MVSINRQSIKICLLLTLTLEIFSSQGFTKRSMLDFFWPAWTCILANNFLLCPPSTKSTKFSLLLHTRGLQTPLRWKASDQCKQQINASTAMPAPLLSMWLRIKLSLWEQGNSHCKTRTLTLGMIAMLLPRPRTTTGRAVPALRGWKKTVEICLCLGHLWFKSYFHLLMGKW